MRKLLIYHGLQENSKILISIPYQLGQIAVKVEHSGIAFFFLCWLTTNEHWVPANVFILTVILILTFPKNAFENAKIQYTNKNQVSSMSSHIIQIISSITICFKFAFYLLNYH